MTRRIARVAFAAALGAMMVAPAAWAADGMQRERTQKSVGAAADALEAALEEADITLFARVDHGEGARSVGRDLGEVQLLIFGTPEVGTPAMADNRLAGLVLPLRMLVYEDADEQVWLAWQDPVESLDGLDGIAADAEYIARMQGALRTFAGRAAE